MRSRWRSLGVLALATALASPVAARELNGFRLEPASIPADEILSGGPPRDGIPALENPEHVAAEAADWRPEEWVVGVAVGSEARAYPLALLVWHELVNDTLGGKPILVSYCPLCGTALVFDRRLEGQTHRFGVSGLLYRSDLLMYDHETESLWSQIEARAVTGALLGKRLRVLRSRIVPWVEWKRAHPRTTVLTRKTGYRRPYGRNPYHDYAGTPQLMFPAPVDPRYHPKMPTLGLRLSDGTARAYPASELVQAGGRVVERFGGGQVEVGYDPDRQVFSVKAPDNVEVIEGFWFAWMAFHPSSSVFVAPPAGKSGPPEKESKRRRAP